MKANRTSWTLLFAGLVGLTAQPVFAADSLVVCEPGRPFLYPNGGANIPWNPDQGALGPLSNAEAVAVVAAAFGTWEAIPESAVSFAQGAALAQDIDATNFGPVANPPAPNGVSEIVFDADGSIFDILFGPGSGILGFAGPDFGDPATCELLEGSSFLNGAAFTDAIVAEDVIVHEFGHYINLGHVELNGQLLAFGEGGDTSGPSPDNTSFGPVPDLVGGNEVVETMYPFYFGPGAGTRTVHKDDIASVSTLYPSATFAATTGSIRGTIFLPDGATRLSGVNIIARNVDNPYVDSVSTFSGAYTDGTAQSDPNVGIYELNGLTPGATYAVFVDTITANPLRFSNPLVTALPSAEEFYSDNESSSDSATDRTDITVSAGSPVTGIDVIFNTPQPGEPLPLGDDDSIELFPPFPITVCGQTYNSLWVNSNGSVSFGAGSTDFSESVADHLNGPPRIAGLWDDLNPTAGGTVTFDEDNFSFYVNFTDVPEFFQTTPNTFTIRIDKRPTPKPVTVDDPDDAPPAPPGNRFEVTYGVISAADGLAGYSCGGAVTSGVEEEIDLSAVSGRVRTRNQTAGYEIFTTGETNDLAESRVRFQGTREFRDVYETNNVFSDAPKIRRLPFNTADARRYSEIAPVGNDVDWYNFTARGDRTIIAEITSGGLDSLIGLYRVNRRYIGDEDPEAEYPWEVTIEQVAVDDDGGAGVLSRIVFPVEETGEYVLAVTTFGDPDFDGVGGTSGGRYVLDIQQIDGIPIDLGDDTSVEVALEFAFPFNGTSYSSVFVNSNGNLTFGSGDTDFSESVSELLADQPRIAALWDDLSPNAGGQVTVDGDENSFSVTFTDVPEFFASTTNTFTVTLSASGAVSVEYGTISAADGIAGVSPGGGATDPGATDLSAAASLSATGVTYESFGFSNPNDTTGITLDFQ